jgi:hypothetical protein
MYEGVMKGANLRHMICGYNETHSEVNKLGGEFS